MEAEWPPRRLNTRALRAPQARSVAHCLPHRTERPVRTYASYRPLCVPEKGTARHERAAPKVSVAARGPSCQVPKVSAGRAPRITIAL
jgi:hypothetical protein